jgi:RNA polymerase-binding transcription factor DksA
MEDMMTPIETRKQQLLDRLAELEARFRHIDTELDTHNGTKDWDDLAIEHEEDEVLEGIGRTGQQEVQRIRAALHRIEAGEYGTCVTCGAEIAEDRLDLLPDTPFCRTCAT